MYLVILNKCERNPKETTKNGQSRYTGNNGHTIHMTKITKTKETTKNGQSRYTGNNGHTIHMTRKTKNTDEQFGPFGELMC
jgi:hypothetical protein